MKRIAGLTLDGSLVHMIIGRTEIPIISASYGDSLSVEKLRELGMQSIRALTPGTYDTTEGKIEVARDVFSTLLAPALDRFGFGNRQYPLIFAFVHPTMGSDSDLIEGCRIVKPDQGLSNDNKPVALTLGFAFTQIYWTDERKTVNALDTSQPLRGNRL